MSRTAAAAGVAAALLWLTAQAHEPRPPKPPHALRWVWCMHNLQANQNADQVLDLIERAARAGYNGVVLADYKLNILDRVPPAYFENVARVRRAAARHNVELI